MLRRRVRHVTQLLLLFLSNFIDNSKNPQIRLILREPVHSIAFHSHSATFVNIKKKNHDEKVESTPLFVAICYQLHLFYLYSVFARCCFSFPSIKMIFLISTNEGNTDDAAAATSLFDGNAVSCSGNEQGGQLGWDDDDEETEEEQERQGGGSYTRERW